MIKQTRFALLTLAIAGLVILLDRLSKIWVVNNIPLYSEAAPIPALYPYFSFLHSANTGVAFGLFQGGTLIFTIIAAIAVVAIAIYSFRSGSQSWLMSVSLGLMLGGAAGNLWDRIAYGAVVDFIKIQASDSLVWPMFNLADSAIVVGTGLLIIYFFLDERKIRNEAHSAGEARQAS
jgi:signal peptidase II